LVDPLPVEGAGTRLVDRFSVERTGVTNQGNQGGVMTKEELKQVLPAVFQECWRRETSYEPGKWSPENPTYGQCAITASVVQDLLGGDLLRAKVNGAGHYWNRLPNSSELDLTRDQFGSAPTTTAPERVSREYVLSFSNTVRRYRQLSRSFMSVLKDRYTRANR